MLGHWRPAFNAQQRHRSTQLVSNHRIPFCLSPYGHKSGKCIVSHPKAQEPITDTHIKNETDDGFDQKQTLEEIIICCLLAHLLNILPLFLLFGLGLSGMKLHVLCTYFLHFNSCPFCISTSFILLSPASRHLALLLQLTLACTFWHMFQFPTSINWTQPKIRKLEMTPFRLPFIHPPFFAQNMTFHSLKFIFLYNRIWGRPEVAQQLNETLIGVNECRRK